MKIPKTAIFLLAISTFISAQTIEAKLFSNPIKNSPTQGVKDVYAGIKFDYFDRDDRLLILNDFLKTVELEYALLPLKVKRIGLDFNQLKVNAIANETAAENILIVDRSDLAERERVSFLQAKANMEFLDRMQGLLALFQDTHFSIREKISRPFVYTGVRLFRIDGKVIVGAIEKKFMAMAQKLSGSDFSTIGIGDEVVAINGQPVEERINKLKKYISGSSNEFIDYQAIRALTIRNFNYDFSNSMTIAFKKAGVFKLPLFANRPVGSTARLDAITFFNKMGIPSDSSTIGMSFDKSSKQWVDGALAYEVVS